MNTDILEFVGLATLLVMICLALLLIPLWRRRRHVDEAGADRRQANIAIYRQRQAEIEREQAEGRLPEAEAEAERQNLGQRLLSDVDEEQAIHAADSGTRPWMASFVLVLFLITGGLATYQLLGSPRALTLRDLPNILEMTRALNARIQMDPADVQARTMLARIQQKEGDYDKAADNLAYLNQEVLPDNPDMLRAEAETRLANDEKLSGRLGDIFERMHDLEPDNPQALWYLGLKASEQDQRDKAKHYWQALLDQPVPSDLKEKAESRLKALEGKQPSLDKD